MKRSSYIDYEMDRIYNRRPLTSKEWRYRLPKGVKLYRRKAYRGELYDRGIFRFKSKGRTGASLRAHMMMANRPVLIDHDPKPSLRGFL